MASIIMIEDSPTNAALYSAYLENEGHTVRLADTGKQALKELDAERPDLILLDLQLPDMDGLTILEKMDQTRAMPPVVVLTGNGSVRAAANAMRAGAVDFLMKPCAAEKLIEAVDAGLSRFRPSEGAVDEASVQAPGTPSKKASSAAKKGPSGFFGKSHAMENVFSLIESAAQSSASVFITGESGTGKELCANAIHKASPRHNGPFVPLNCAAIPRELIESEIFGHRKGSFTGAVQDREGAAGLADGGTLFLDEICEMDLDLQAKLLRFIQTGTYRRVGDSVDRQTDIRFVCATNRDPYVEVHAGRFREDLYYRLHVVPIVMPPLRDRGDDVRSLAERFLKNFAAIEGKDFQSFDGEAVDVIRRYPWPGNVRQLENTIRNIVVLNNAETVTAGMIPPLPGGGVVGSVPPAAAAAPGPMPVSPAAPLGAAQPPSQSISGDEMPSDRWFVRPIEELEILAIEAAIRCFDGNVTKASRALNISTSSIYRKKKAWEERSS